MSSFSVRLRCLLIGALVFAAVVVATPGAMASADCDAPTSTPFAPWNDFAAYALAPDGGFEDGAAGWQLSGDASVVAGNEPWLVNGAEDGSSLWLGAGDSALSPPVCITVAHPTLRFFVDGDGLLPTLVVSVVLNDGEGLIRELPIGVVATGGQWRPTAPLPVLVNLLAPLAPNGQLQARFRFAPLLGRFRIDDVYIDPWKTT